MLSLIYSSIHQSHIDSNLDILERYEGQYVNYAGVVREVYRRDDYQDEYIVDIQLVAKNTLKNKSKSIYSIVKVPKNFQLQPGQDIEFSGRFQMIEDFDSFAYKNFLLSKSIYFRTSVSKVDIISESTSITQKIFIFRERLISVIGELYPKNEAIFLAGILFGARENIPSDLKTDFNNSGLTHFIAVSGFNITLCIIFVSFLFAYFPIWFRVIGVISTILTFSFFVGLGAPVVRASIMGILGYIFIQSGSPVRNIVLLTFTAVCMALWSPLALVYDVSLHLSFLAVIGIIYTQELFQKIFSFLPSSFAIREAFVLTLSALSFSLPIMLFQFGQVSLLAPLANIAVTWTIPLAMLGGAMSVVLYFIFPPLAELTGFITWIFLRYDIMIVQFFGNKEGALFIFEIGNYKFFAESLYFILLIYFLIMYHLKIKKNEL
ncbi:ComEC family competence protein [Candidatus Gracilibacteria bacterium]|nr:ComEC family competence protein [Candidatus Gracilibacteria bacterium]